ncbi:MAG: serine/threonine-protein kinase [Polyangiaceae bacterium]
MFAVGQVIHGKYRLLRLLGDGGMGTVFEGHHEMLGTKVAIKVLHPELTRRPGLVERFLQEARVSAQIRSPHVVQVTDIDRTPDGTAYIVMELLEGETLSSVLDRQKKLPVPLACEYTRQILEALEAAHALGIVHRDLKPENVFVTFALGRPVLKLIDFGIAKFRRSEPGAKNMTVAGVMMGTAEYMAPEQAYSADQADARSDVYAVGVMLYEMIAGVRPVDGADARIIAVKVERGEVVPLLNVAPHAPGELAGLVHRAMASRPDMRFSGAAEMRIALANAQSGKRTGAAVAVDPDTLGLGETMKRSTMMGAPNGGVFTPVPPNPKAASPGTDPNALPERTARPGQIAPMNAPPAAPYVAAAATPQRSGTSVGDAGYSPYGPPASPGLYGAPPAPGHYAAGPLHTGEVGGRRRRSSPFGVVLLVGIPLLVGAGVGAAFVLPDLLGGGTNAPDASADLFGSPTTALDAATGTSATPAPATPGPAAPVAPLQPLTPSTPVAPAPANPAPRPPVTASPTTPKVDAGPAPTTAPSTAPTTIPTTAPPPFPVPFPFPTTDGGGIAIPPIQLPPGIPTTIVIPGIPGFGEFPGTQPPAAPNGTAK